MMSKKREINFKIFSPQLFILFSYYIKQNNGALCFSTAFLTQTLMYAFVIIIAEMYVEKEQKKIYSDVFWQTSVSLLFACAHSLSSPQNLKCAYSRKKFQNLN
jgi:hypothetical protein